MACHQKQICTLYVVDFKLDQFDEVRFRLGRLDKQLIYRLPISLEFACISKWHIDIKIVSTISSMSSVIKQEDRRLSIYPTAVGML